MNAPRKQPLYEWIDVREVMSEAPSEDALQEALLEALRVWPEHPPHDPTRMADHGRDAAAGRRPPQRHRRGAHAHGHARGPSVGFY
jgi:predicted RNA polymerase sigma factor